MSITRERLKAYIEKEGVKKGDPIEIVSTGQFLRYFCYFGEEGVTCMDELGKKVLFPPEVMNRFRKLSYVSEA